MSARGNLDENETSPLLSGPSAGTSKTPKKETCDLTCECDVEAGECSIALTGYKKADADTLKRHTKRITDMMLRTQEFFWQAIPIVLMSESFLLTISLSQSNSAFAVKIASALGLAIAAFTHQAFMRNKHTEDFYNNILERLEQLSVEKQSELQRQKLSDLQREILERLEQLFVEKQSELQRQEQSDLQREILERLEQLFVEKQSELQRPKQSDLQREKRSDSLQLEKPSDSPAAPTGQDPAPAVSSEPGEILSQNTTGAVSVEVKSIFGKDFAAAKRAYLNQVAGYWSVYSTGCLWRWPILWFKRAKQLLYCATVTDKFRWIFVTLYIVHITILVRAFMGFAP
jgi:hypothetical protein